MNIESSPLNTLLIIDDHPLFIAGLKQYLAGIDNNISVREATNGKEARQALAQDPVPDMVFLDLQLPDLDGVHFLDELRRQQITCPVLVISGRQEPAWVHNALRAGANGYLSKAAPQLELRDALKSLSAGGRYISTHLRRSLDDYRAGLSAQQAGQLKLTRRQHSVLKLIADGMNNREISETLNISESTVKGHISTLFDILNVENRTSCLREARNFGIL